MFTIHGIRPHGRHTVEIDEYVPLTIQWPGYARLRQTPQAVVLDAGASLVEVKTDRDSGAVVELVLVDTGRPEHSDTPLFVPRVLESGIPALSYAESAQDGSVGGVQLYSDGLRVRFGQERVSRAVGDPDAGFGFSEAGHLVEFGVRLDLDRMARLRAAWGLG
ncbi:hypothetical protein ACFWR9_34615 [Streptomyces sp. NPDC058534]|uniref:hypothetical protein n=1 Tax=Streptomyces sp. NPDC058534 TaxID=3346541 RepID=UPI00365C7ECE